jgi:hypothetical protein
VKAIPSLIRIGTQTNFRGWRETIKNGASYYSRDNHGPPDSHLTGGYGAASGASLGPQSRRELAHVQSGPRSKAPASYSATGTGQHHRRLHWADYAAYCHVLMSAARYSPVPEPQ